MSDSKHQWRFFRAGDFEQPLIENAADLQALAELDQKLWATLACPTDGLNISTKFLQMLDADSDGRIRAPEIIRAVEWALARLENPNCLFEQRPLLLTDFKDDEQNHNLLCSAQRLLELLGREQDGELSAADTEDPAVIFPPTAANGDGLVPAQLTDDDSLKQQIGQIIECFGAEIDRSGEPAINADKVKDFYSQIEEIQQWHKSADENVQAPFGQATEQVIPLLARLKDKINDFFTRVELVAYDSRAANIMAAAEDELQRLSTSNLAALDALRDLPLANLEQSGGISFSQGINPAWQADMQALYEQAVLPQWGKLEQLSKEHWQQLLDQAQAYFSWQAAKPAGEVAQSLPLEDILAIDAEKFQPQIEALIALDLEVEDAAQGWMDLDRILNMQQHLIPLLKNFVSFEHFYGRKDKAVFQAGQLFIDGKSCDLVVEVKDVEAHSAVATQSNSFLIYCRCVRRDQSGAETEQKNIVALISAGADHELMLGRNGLFYDRDGNDWDATIVKVIENAISVREAFWSPYRRIAGMISNQIQKLASSQDEQLMAKAAQNVESGAAPAPFDIAKFAGIFAAIGLAIGAIGTALAAAFAGLLALNWWQWPLVIVGLIVVISGPSMLMAWFKLRRRSLGPILDANGWAVNAQARISINFGTSLTQVASLPLGSGHSLRDPYAKKSRAGWWLLLIVAAALVLGWFYQEPLLQLLNNSTAD